MLNTDWMDEAACKEYDINVFFPPKGHQHLLAKARAICGACPVQEDCLEYALQLSTEVEVIGIWGGLSGRQREAIMFERAMPQRTRAYDASIIDD